MKNVILGLCLAVPLLSGTQARAACTQDLEVLGEALQKDNTWHDLFVMPMFVEGMRLCQNGREAVAMQRINRAFRLFENLNVLDLVQRTSSWNTNFGPTTFTVLGNTIVGAYPQYGGKIHGTLQGGTAEGIWYQTTQSQRPCRNMKYGSYSWGRFVIRFVGRNTLRGVWAYCRENPRNWGSWKGSRRSGPMPNPTQLR